MPEAIALLRTAAAKNAGNKYGLKLQPKSTSGEQKTGPGEYPDLFALPVDISTQLPLQDTDSTSGTFTQPWFYPDFDWPDNPLRPPY